MALELALESVPSTASLYARALISGRSGTLPPSPALLATATLKEQRIDRQRLAEYRQVCGFDGNRSGYPVPATYPFVMAMPLQLSLLVSDAFPFPVLGIVHLRNDITQYRPIDVADHLDFCCELAGPRAVRRGFEFDLTTRVYSGGELVWVCVSTMLRPEKPVAPGARSGARKSDLRTARPSADMVQARVVADWQIGADMGRRYGRVSGDRNPIHLYALSAKLFGFPCAIAHGMWTKARCLAELEAALVEAGQEDKLAAPFVFGVEFRKPILLPASVKFISDLSEGQADFQLHSSGGRSAHLLGSFRPL